MDGETPKKRLSQFFKGLAQNLNQHRGGPEHELPDLDEEELEGRTTAAEYQADDAEFARRASMAAARAMQAAPIQIDPSLLNSLDPGYFTADFDPIRHMLESPSGRDVDDETTEMFGLVEVLNKRLHTLCNQNYEQFVQGMNHVCETEKDLQLTRIIIRNGRRKLQNVEQGLVHNAIRILYNFKKREGLQEVIRHMHDIKRIGTMEIALAEAIQQYDFRKALDLCDGCKAYSDFALQFDCCESMVERLTERENLIRQNIDATLMKLTQKFDPVQYEQALLGYERLGKMYGLVERLQYCVVEHLKMATHEVLLDCVLKEPSAALNRVTHHAGPMSPGPVDLTRLDFKDLCGLLQEEQFVPCLMEVYAVLTDLLYHSEMLVRWHHKGSRASQYTEVKSALKESKRVIWDLMQRRVAIFLGSSTLSTFKIETFLSITHATNKFIEAGEEYSESESNTLRQSIRQKGKAYFEAFHRDSLEVIRGLLENELWQRFPIPSGFSIADMKEMHSFVGEGRARARRQVDEDDDEGGKVSAVSVFDLYTSTGNPFRKAEEPAVEKEQKGSPSGRADDDDNVDSDPALQRDYVESDGDYDSDNPKPPPPPTARRDAGGPVGSAGTRDMSNGIVFTSTSLNMVKFIGKYLGVMEVLPPMAFDAFSGMAQLFEYCLFTIYSFFGVSDPMKHFIALQAFANGQQAPSTPSQTGPSGHQDDGFELDERLSTRLRSCILRVRDRFDPSKRVFGSPTTASSATNRAIRIPELRSSLELTSPVTMFGLTERTVAAESLLFMGEVLRSLRPRLQDLVPKGQIAFLVQFYSQTVDVIEELRSHIYRVVACAMIQTDAFVGNIAGLKACLFKSESGVLLMMLLQWDIKDLGSEHNSYVEAMIGIRADTVPPEAQNLLWKFAVIHAMECLVEGYSRVKKCTTEGRALMSLDLQTFSSKMAQVCPIKPLPHLQHVETYIKAWYFNEIDLLGWIRHHHSQYPRRHILALVNSGCGAPMKKKTKQDYLAKVEEILDQMENNPGSKMSLEEFFK